MPAATAGAVTDVDTYLQEESDALADIAGLDLGGVLREMGETSDGLDALLGGVRGTGVLSRKQIYKDDDDEGGDDDGEYIGMERGDDWEDEVDKEIERDDPQPRGPMQALQLVSHQQAQAQQPQGTKRKKRIIVRRAVERQKSVYELYPDFEHNGVLQFTKLFHSAPGYKSRISGDRNFQGSLISYLV